MTRKKKTRPTDHARKAQDAPGSPAEAAAAFLAGQEITTTDCRQCGSVVSGLNGRYACGICGWVNAWHEGHGELPVAQDDPDWPGHSRSA
ncbi:hypothetical protein ACFVWR_18360 [Leifsonia sp. NPDC058292]|uniref:hypothetical protein n=1 Tax=Leifsonia sp. NPDC058292 TaxID=3346428 RepID=UPI0036D9C6A3